MISILDCIREIKDNYKRLSIVILSFVFIANVYSTFFLKTDYTAKVKVFIGKQKFENTSNSYNNDEVVLYQRLITTYSEIIKSKKLINNAIDESKVNALKGINEVSYSSVISNLTVNPITNTQIIEIEYKSKDSQSSYDLLYSITENLIKYSKELYPTVNIKVIEQVNVSGNNIISKSIMILAIAFILGAMFSIGGLIMIMYLNNTYKNKEILEEELGIPVVGAIPNIDNINN